MPPLRDKGLLFDAFFRYNGNNSDFSKKDQIVAKHAYTAASEKIGPSDCGKDDIEKFYKITEEALMKHKRVFAYFKDSSRAKDNFQENFEHWKRHCKPTTQKLRNMAGELRSLRKSRDTVRFFGNMYGAAGGILAATTVACPPFAITSGIIATVASTVSIIATVDEMDTVKERLREAVDLIEEEKRRYSAMRWFSCSEEEKEAVSSLVDSQTLKRMAQKVENFRKLTDTKDMSEDEFRTHYESVLNYSMDLMAEDKKLIERFGKELAPVVMTYVFVVCLMDDHNRIKLDHSLKTLDLMNSLKVGLPGLAIGAIAFLSISGLISGLLGAVINILLSAYNFIDSCRGPNTEYTSKIDEAADKIEEIFAYIERVYNETKKYKSHDPVTEWKSIVVQEIPVDARSEDLKMAVKPYLPEAARSRIKLLKLTTHEWLVMVPACHSQRLLQQTQITVKGKSCGVAP